MAFTMSLLVLLISLSWNLKYSSYLEIIFFLAFVFLLLNFKTNSLNLVYGYNQTFDPCFVALIKLSKQHWFFDEHMYSLDLNFEMIFQLVPIDDGLCEVSLEYEIL
jgi:hypothetical protein